MKFTFDTDLISRCEIKKPYTALVFSYLLKYCKENNGSFDKSILFLTAELKLARKTVYEAIFELMEKQYLIKELNGDTNKKVPNVYRIDFNKVEATKKNKAVIVNKEPEIKNILPVLPNVKISKDSYYSLCLDLVDNPKILLLLLMYYDVRQDINKRIKAKSIAQRTINAFANNIKIAVQMVCLNAGRVQDIEKKISRLTKEEKEVFNNKQRKIQLILDNINKDKLNLDIRQQSLIEVEAIK